MQDTLALTHYIRCGRKRPRSRTRAGVLARKLTKRLGTLYIAYECFDCGYYHVGRADNTQLLVREREKQKKEALGVKRKRKQAKMLEWEKRKNQAIEDGNFCERCGEEISDERYQPGNEMPIYCSRVCREKAKAKRAVTRRTEQKNE